MTTQTPWHHLITMRMLKGELNHEQGERAFRDPKAFKLSRTMATGKDISLSRYKWWGRVKTARMDICYCWSTKRNEAGYFIGWREVYENGKMVRRDQWMARKNKTRLMEFMLRRTADAMDRGKTTKNRTEAVAHYMNILETTGTLSKRKGTRQTDYFLDGDD